LQGVLGDRDELRSRGGAAGHGEHEQLLTRTEHGPKIAHPHAIDVRFIVFVTGDRNLAAKVANRADPAEVVVASEVGVGVASDLVEKNLALNVGSLRSEMVKPLHGLR